MFGFKRSTYRFDVVHSDSIDPQPIKDADALVNYVIGVNNDLLDKDEKGWLFIEKLKESKKGSTVLYAARLELPLLEDNSYFDQLLSPFYTKKKVAYDESLITPVTENITDDTTPDTPELPADLAALIQKGNEQLQPDSVSNEISDQSVVSTLEPAAVDSSNQIQESTTLQEVELLKQQLKAKQDEIEQLQQKEERPLPGNESQLTLNATTADETAKILPEEKSGLYIHDSEPAVLSLQPSEQSVAAVIDRVRKDISSELEAFVLKETEKIQEEIQRLDRRGTIEKEISGRIQVEMDQQLDSDLSFLDDKKEKLIREEELRHHSTLKEIEDRHLKEREARIEEINSLFDQRYQAEFSKEYNQQTEQLVKILEGRQAELSRRQQELNDGLQANFANTLATFNQSHKKMIEIVERQKEVKQPVQLLKQA